MDQAAAGFSVRAFCDRAAVSVDAAYGFACTHKARRTGLFYSGTAGEIRKALQIDQVPFDASAEERGDRSCTERLTPFGKKLRSTSLDELPELFNILKGDMSIVGPRPLLMRYLERYNSHQARRGEVRPGLTGLSQVHGRNAISWEERFDLDVKYVDHITFLGDWKIILETVKTVLKREGISAEGEATMGEFMGSNTEKDDKDGE